MSRIDQELGYGGRDRFVLFYYEPRERQVKWRDSQSCGSGCSGWPSNFASIEAKAQMHGLSLGNHKAPGDHVLLVDRVEEHACFAWREEAQEFLARFHAIAS